MHLLVEEANENHLEGSPAAPAPAAEKKLEDHELDVSDLRSLRTLLSVSAGMAQLVPSSTGPV